MISKLREPSPLLILKLILRLSPSGNADGIQLAGLEVVHEQLLVVAQGADEFLYGLKPAAHGPGAAFLENP